jgi:hydrogenase maturation protease
LGVGIDVVDGGTGGFHLLSLFHDYPRIVMIDAAADGKPPGTVSVLKPRFASDFPKSLSAHDIGLKDLIEAATLLGGLPEIDLITVSVDKIQPMSLDLSPAVAAALPEIERLVRELTGRV